MTRNSKRFYIYAWLRHKTTERGKKGSPYYIGKGSGNRAWSNSGRSTKKPRDPSLIVLLRQGLEEEEAYQWEIFYIAHYGRVDQGTGILHNKTDGGEGVRGANLEGRVFGGWKHSDETRRMYSETRKGANNANYGNKHSLRAKGIMRARKAKYLYELIDTDGEVYMTESLRDFCAQYQLERRSLMRLLNGEKSRYQGVWEIRIAEVLK